MGFYEMLLEHIEEDLIPDAIEQVRAGHYIAAITGVYRSFRRTQISPEWNDDPIDWVVRIASPILDVMPAAGTRMAVMSQDGAVDYAATVGQIWDDLAPQMTVWIRAHLGTQPGRLEVGAARSVKITAGVEDTLGVDAMDSLGIEELPDGMFKVEAPTIHIGNDAGEVVRDLSDVCQRLTALTGAAKRSSALSAAATTFTTATPAPGVASPATNAALLIAMVADGATRDAALTAIEGQLVTLQANIDSMKS